MYYIHTSDRTFTGYKSRSLSAAVKMCNEYPLPADIRELKPKESSFCEIIYSNLRKSENIYLKRS